LPLCTYSTRSCQLPLRETLRSKLKERFFLAILTLAPRAWYLPLPPWRASSRTYAPEVVGAGLTEPDTCSVRPFARTLPIFAEEAPGTVTLTVGATEETTWPASSKRAC